MPTHYAGTRNEVRALNAYINLMRAADSVTAKTSAITAQHDLTVSQFGVLEALLHLGPLHQGQLAEKILRTSGNITMVVGNLERRGLVVRKRGKDDRRFVTVQLTDPGRKLVGRVFPKVVAAILGELGCLTGAEQEDLRRLCRRLGRGDGSA